MARKSFSVLFFIKKGKLLKNGEAPVCMRITVNGYMVDISIKRSCPVNLWNQAKENSKGKDRMSVELNHYLEITRSRIHQIYRELESAGKTITVDLMRKLYYGVDEDSKTLLQVFREHNEQSRELIGKDFVSKTVQRYETTTRYLEEFIKKEYQLSDIALNNLEANFIFALILDDLGPSPETLRYRGKPECTLKEISNFSPLNITLGLNPSASSPAFPIFLFPQLIVTNSFFSLIYFTLY